MIDRSHDHYNNMEYTTGTLQNTMKIKNSVTKVKFELLATCWCIVLCVNEAGAQPTWDQCY